MRDRISGRRGQPGPREWWRLAHNPAGELVGLSPGRRHGDPLIGRVGVVPEHRGHGHAYDLLVEATHKLADEVMDRIVAGTDQTNVPMAAQFARVGYTIAQESIDLIQPRDKKRVRDSGCDNRVPHPRSRAHQDHTGSRSASRIRSSSRRLHAGHHLANGRAPVRLLPAPFNRPGFDVSCFVRAVQSSSALYAA
ncbi:GNAT family N-acetyltransferase [Streptomyces sp. NPDC001970]